MARTPTITSEQIPTYISRASSVLEVESPAVTRSMYMKAMKMTAMYMVHPETLLRAFCREHGGSASWGEMIGKLYEAPITADSPKPRRRKLNASTSSLIGWLGQFISESPDDIGAWAFENWRYYLQEQGVKVPSIGTVKNRFGGSFVLAIDITLEMMRMANLDGKITFGVSTPLTEGMHPSVPLSEAVEKLSEGSEWSFVSWEGPDSIYYMIVCSKPEVKLHIRDQVQCDVVPLSEMLDAMGDNRNKWIWPLGNDTAGAKEMADIEIEAFLGVGNSKEDFEPEERQAFVHITAPAVEGRRRRSRLAARDSDQSDSGSVEAEILALFQED